MRTTCVPEEPAVRHLTLVPPASARKRIARRTRVTLAGAPYRPGELPHPMAMALPVDITADANERARQLCLPVELLFRASVDAARVLRALANVAIPRQPAISLLDEAAAQAGSTLSPSSLVEYALLVRRGEPASVTRVPEDQRLELMLPLDVAASWRLGAEADGQTVDEWAVGLYREAPSTACSWEVASAAAGLRVGEWAYACALRRSAACNASPQALA